MVVEYSNEYEEVDTDTMQSMLSGMEAEETEAKKRYEALAGEANLLRTQLCYRYLLLDHGLQRGDVVCRTKLSDYGEQHRSYWFIEGARMHMARTQRGDNRKREFSIYVRAWRKDGKRPLGSRSYRQNTIMLHRGIETSEVLSIVKDEAATAATIAWEEEQKARREAEQPV